MEMGEKGYFPLFVDLSNKKILVVGAGTIATRRIKVLSQFSSNIVVVSKEISEEVSNLERNGIITVYKREVIENDFQNLYMVVTATNDKHVNDWVAKKCKNKCYVNHAGDQTQSDFYFPGIVKDKNYVIGITASGKDHKGAKRATAFIREVFSKYCNEIL